MRTDLWREELEDQRREKDEAFKHDPNSPIPPGERRGFKGLSYYPPDPRYRIEAKLVAEPHQDLNIQRSAGDVVLYTRLGHFAFTLPGGDVKLALYESDGHAFLPFRDKTSGKDTYGAGRYLEPMELGGGRFLLDFNLAYNPFCAYNEEYSCPFPPPENWLQVPVEAGEKAYGEH